MCLFLKKKELYFITAAFTLVLLSGCKKNHEYDLRPNLNAANDQILANRPFLYVFQMLVKATTDSLLQTTLHATIDGSKVTLDSKKQKYIFAFQGEKSDDSVTRIGSFTAMVDSGFFHQGTVISMTFQGYGEDGHLVTGHDSIVCNGILNGTCVYHDFITGAVITKDSVRIIQFSAGYEISVTPSAVFQGITQSVITCIGTSSGISSGGYPFTAGITSPVTLNEFCPWISDGVISFSIPGADIPTGTIEFMGKTSCNGKVNYNFEGNSYSLLMKNSNLLN